MTTEIQVKGLAELGVFLQQLPAKLQNNGMRGAMRAGGKVFVDDIQGKLPVTPRSDGSEGELKDSVRVGTSAQGTTIYAHVRMGDKDAFWWHFYEFGTAAHDIKPKSAKSLFLAGLLREVVHHPGARPNPVMRTSMDAKAPDAVVAAGNYLKNYLASDKIAPTYGTSAAAQDEIHVG